MNFFPLAIIDYRNVFGIEKNIYTYIIDRCVKIKMSVFIFGFLQNSFVHLSKLIPGSFDQIDSTY